MPSIHTSRHQIYSKPDSTKTPPCVQVVAVMMARTNLQNMVPSKAALASSSTCCCERETLLCRILIGKPETLKSHPSSVKKAGSYISHMTLTKVRSAVRWDLVGARKTLHPGFSLTTLQRSSSDFEEASWTIALRGTRWDRLSQTLFFVGIL